MPETTTTMTIILQQRLLLLPHYWKKQNIRVQKLQTPWVGYKCELGVFFKETPAPTGNEEIWIFCDDGVEKFWAHFVWFLRNRTPRMDSSSVIDQDGQPPRASPLRLEKGHYLLISDVLTSSRKKPWPSLHLGSITHNNPLVHEENHDSSTWKSLFKP